MSSISTVQRPTPRTSVRRSMIAASSSFSSVGRSGTIAASDLAARSLSAATLANEKPAARNRSTGAASTCCGVGKEPWPTEATRRARMVLAAVPFSC